jgi:hypothetical protein
VVMFPTEDPSSLSPLVFHFRVSYENTEDSLRKSCINTFPPQNAGYPRGILSDYMLNFPQVACRSMA